MRATVGDEQQDNNTARQWFNETHVKLDTKEHFLHFMYHRKH
jgi:hypothetical protein